MVCLLMLRGLVIEVVYRQLVLLLVCIYSNNIALDIGLY